MSDCGTVNQSLTPISCPASCCSSARPLMTRGDMTVFRWDKFSSEISFQSALRTGWPETRKPVGPFWIMAGPYSRIGRSARALMMWAWVGLVRHATRCHSIVPAPVQAAAGFALVGTRVAWLTAAPGWPVLGMCFLEAHPVRCGPAFGESSELLFVERLEVLDRHVEELVTAPLAEVLQTPRTVLWPSMWEKIFGMPSSSRPLVMASASSSHRTRQSLRRCDRSGR